MSDTPEYAFRDDLIEQVQSGNKTATVRVADERHPEPGDVVDAVDTDGRQFASLRVRASIRVPACYAHEMVNAFNARHAANSPGQMVKILNEHYQDVGSSDPVHVLIFGVVSDE